MPENETAERAALEEMRTHVDAAYAAADKLVREAQRQAEAAAADAEDVPPRGWAAPSAASQPGRSTELQALLGLIELGRGTIPPELADQFAEALRQLLVALRALIDYAIARLDRQAAAPAEVEDIPIQ